MKLPEHEPESALPCEGWIFYDGGPMCAFPNDGN